MDDHEIIAATKDLDADELADLAPELPRDVVHELMESLDAQQRERVRSALSYEEDQVGALMDFEMVTIREDVSLEVVLRYLRRLKELPGHTDKLFVVDYDGVLKGVLPIKRLLVNDPDKQVLEVMATDPVTFHPDEDGYDAAQAFERYDLISAPVVDKGGKLIGRLTIDEMVDLIREESESEVLNMAGLREEEDIFASVWKSVRNRWAWLATNLITAFVASRVIGLFEGSIEKLVALAALMPIVAGIGGNSGNQTITMIVRAIALDQVQPTSNSRNRLLRKELGVALVNGLAWGGVIGVVAFYLYGNWELGVVMTAAMTLNLLLAAMMGVLIPMTLHRFGRDPAMGSSVMITAMTDSGGFHLPRPGDDLPDVAGRHASRPRAAFMAVRSAETFGGDQDSTLRQRSPPLTKYSSTALVSRATKPSRRHSWSSQPPCSTRYSQPSDTAQAGQNSSRSAASSWRRPSTSTNSTRQVRWLARSRTRMVRPARSWRHSRNQGSTQGGAWSRTASSGSARSATDAQGQALEEVAQQLVAAGPVVAVTGLAKQGAQLGFGDREVDAVEDGMEVFLLEFEGDPQLLQDHVVAQRQLQRR